MKNLKPLRTLVREHFQRILSAIAGMPGNNKAKNMADYLFEGEIKLLPYASSPLAIVHLHAVDECFEYDVRIRAKKQYVRYIPRLILISWLLTLKRENRQEISRDYIETLVKKTKIELLDEYYHRVTHPNVAYCA